MQSCPTFLPVVPVVHDGRHVRVDYGRQVESDHLRKKQVRKEDAPVATDSSGETYDVLEQVADIRAGANPERDLMRRELGTRISSALEKLTPRERMVFELKHYHGLKLRTVGEVLNTTEETAKNTLFRATQKLRGALADMR